MGTPWSVLANELDCDIVIRKIKLKSIYYDPYLTNTIDKCMKFHLQSAMA